MCVQQVETKEHFKNDISLANIFSTYIDKYVRSEIRR